jgi:hypothetical protein
MRVNLFAVAAVVAAMMPAAAMADEPRDPATRSAIDRSHDHETIRQLNLHELAMVRQRDAQYAEGWRATRGNTHSADANPEYRAHFRDHERAMADYARSRARYEQEMAEWRRAVVDCRKGNYSACAN